MPPTPVQRTAQVIREDRAGRGQCLAFPQMSSCAAVIAVLDTDLVGGHFTADLAPGDTPPRHVLDNIGRMQEMIGAAPIRRLLIVGFNQNHQPAQICAALGCGRDARGETVVEAYDLARKKPSEMTVFATFIDAHSRPIIEFKRQSSVTEARHRPAATLEEARVYPADLEVKYTLHTLRKHFTNL